MKILIDIGHPAHVHYFRNFIGIMQEKGHEFFVTARDKEVSHQLLNIYKIPFNNRGKGSKNIVGKIVYGFKADIIVYMAAKHFKPDLFLSFASPYAGQVAKFLGKPHISFTDTEHAKLGIMSFAPFSDCIITPNVFKRDFGSKHIYFRGNMELSYLHPNYFSANKSIKSELDLREDEPYSVLRFISWNANHDIGQSGIPNANKLELVRRMKREMKVFISSENCLPKELVNYQINISPEKIHDVLAYANLYIGEASTMATESAIVGTPAIYVNSLKVGTTEAQQNYGLLFSYRNFDGVLSKLDELIKNPYLKLEFSMKREKMLKDQIDVTSFMVWFIENYPDSARIMKENPEFQERFK